MEEPAAPSQREFISKICDLQRDLIMVRKGYSNSDAGKVLSLLVSEYRSFAMSFLRSGQGDVALEYVNKCDDFLERNRIFLVACHEEAVNKSRLLLLYLRSTIYKALGEYDKLVRSLSAAMQSEKIVFGHTLPETAMQTCATIVQNVSPMTASDIETAIFCGHVAINTLQALERQLSLSDLQKSSFSTSWYLLAIAQLSSTRPEIREKGWLSLDNCIACAKNCDNGRLQALEQLCTRVRRNFAPCPGIAKVKKAPKKRVLRERPPKCAQQSGYRRPNAALEKIARCVFGHQQLKKTTTTTTTSKKRKVKVKKVPNDKVTEQKQHPSAQILSDAAVQTSCSSHVGENQSVGSFSQREPTVAILQVRNTREPPSESTAKGRNCAIGDKGDENSESPSPSPSALRSLSSGSRMSSSYSSTTDDNSFTDKSFSIGSDASEGY